MHKQLFVINKKKVAQHILLFNKVEFLYKDVYVTFMRGDFSQR